MLCKYCMTPGRVIGEGPSDEEGVRVEFPTLKAVNYFKHYNFVHDELCYYHNKVKEGLFNGNRHGRKDLFTDVCFGGFSRTDGIG